ncbi:MAG TPA: zinc ribbon domain-containing protein [Thermoanaerobaculia bacterium]|jgi:predicted nucleic acid-binding Zn ribbon protein
MRCPECKALNEASAAACSSCGLLLLNSAPKRRAEDLAVKKRRQSDNDSAECRFCGGAVPPNAIRCKHCSEVLDENFYRERAQRLRSRINYTSWVLYLFGLGALLVFRPVGILSIAAGLLLSIAYYAVPVEPPSSPRSKSKSSFGTMIRRQLKLERVSIPLPALRNRKLVFVGTPLVAALIGYSANLLLLQEPVNDILRENAAFRGMKVSAHYQYYVIPGVVVYDLEGLSFRQTPIDVHTAFLEFAKKLKEKRYTRVDLSYRGTTKFSMDGASFMKLGQEYAKRNFDYVLYNAPRLVQPAEGTKPIPPNGSGRDTLLEFHRSWYGEDVLTKTVANGL